MKFRHVNVHALEAFVPRWFGSYVQLGRELDRLLDASGLLRRVVDVTQPLPFSIEVEIDQSVMRVCEPTPEHAGGYASRVLARAGSHLVQFPLNNILKGYPLTPGTHCVYSHSFGLETSIGYTGISSRPWYVRYAEHQAAARNGSRFLFHEALRRHQNVAIHHQVIASGLDLDSAMKLEELLVAACSLYPIGLNMIPGGVAGLKYLSSLNISLLSTEGAPAAIAEAMTRANVAGRPNPLCAARWESDPDYVARVICGHSGRLTVEQIQMARAMCIAGHQVPAIREATGARNDAQINRLLATKTYSRVAP